MGGLSSKRKGANGEREFRDVVRAAGFEARRDGQTRVRVDPDDVNLDVRHDVPGVHMEVKRCETYMIDKWLAQAEFDATRQGGLAPWVCFRKSKRPWRVICRADWLLGVMRELVGLRAENEWLAARLRAEHVDEYVEIKHPR